MILILRLTIYFIFLYYLHAKAELLKFSVYLSYSLHKEGLLILIIFSIISALIGYLCARILRDINKLILILISIAAFVAVLINRDLYLGFINLYSSFFIIIGILLYRKKIRKYCKNHIYELFRISQFKTENEFRKSQ